MSFEELKQEDTNLFSYNGFIGRRNYIANSLIIAAIVTASVVLTGKYVDSFNIEWSIKHHPVWMIAFAALSLLATVLSGFNINKRLSDITGKELKETGALSVCLILIAVNIVSCINFDLLLLLTVLMIVFELVFFIAKGNLSSKLPKSEIAKFNWGAFFGTWIWGIFNKSYMTLFAFPLLFTPAFFIFQIVLGLKGNEWAYKNKNYESTEQLHKSQKKQALFWSVLTVIVFVVVTFGAIVGMLNFAKTFAKGDKIKASSIEQIYEKRLQKYFVSHDFKNGEYKYFADPIQWKNMVTSQKITSYSSAVTHSAHRMLMDAKSPNDIPSENEIYKKTKIYSSLNGELLLEYKPEEIRTEGSFIERTKSSLNAYKINSDPET